MKKVKTIVLTGGGTMGHISPNLAIIPSLFYSFNKVCYIGEKTGLEREKIEKLNKDSTEINKKVEFYPITATKLDRVKWYKNFLLPFKLISGIIESRKVLKKLNPDVVFSKGGYVAVPVVIAAHMLKIPIVIHESDLSLGLANKLSRKKATTLCTTFAETADKYSNGVYTGSPVNPKIFMGDANKIKQTYKLKPNLKTILITGGSLGSSEINKQIEKILPSIATKYNILHLTGKNKRVKFSHQNYHQLEYTDDIGSFFKASDLVISRAGSNTIFELASLNKPMLLIPLPKNASRGDQIENANYFKRLGIAEVVDQENLQNNFEKIIDNTIKKIPQMQTKFLSISFPNGKQNILNEIYKASNINAAIPNSKSVKKVS